MLSRPQQRSGNAKPKLAKPCHAQGRLARNTRAHFWRQTLADGVSPYEDLQGVPVKRVSDGNEVELPSQWGSRDVAVVVFARSFGCPFCQELARGMARETIPALAGKGHKVFMVSIGTPKTGKEFAKKTGFPPGLLFADEDNATYNALGLNQGFAVTYLSPLTPVAIASRALRSGVQDLTEVMKDWVPWQPPRGTKQASVQGGTLIFQGNDCVWSYRDKATADHADMREVAEVVEGIVQGSFAQQPR